MLKVLRGMAFAAALLALFVSTAVAQSATTGAIAGVVRDTTGPLCRGPLWKPPARR